MIVFRPSDIIAFIVFIAMLMLAAPLIAIVQAVWPVFEALLWISLVVIPCYAAFSIGRGIYRWWVWRD